MTLGAMKTDATVLAAVGAGFAGVGQPEHFTDFAHCCGCAERDELLRSRNRDTLKIEDVGNPGWDPLCFCSAEGITYFPALALQPACRPDVNG